jgi:hypothetical protein
MINQKSGALSYFQLQRLATASHCTNVDCYLERRREADKIQNGFLQNTEMWVALLTAFTVQVLGHSQSNWKDAFQFCYAGCGLLHAQKVWVIMREEFCYCTVSDNTTLFPNHTFQIISD